MDHDTACTILGIDKALAQLQKTLIDKAYRKAALDSHPDRGGSNEIFQDVASAKSLLLEEIETGKRVVKGDNNGEESTTSDGQDMDQSTIPRTGGNHGWMGSKYDTPSTQSPLSPLRQMGRPLDVKQMPSNEVVDLWNSRRLQCVWRCETCDAVCCRVRRDKFRCVCGHQLKHHDPGKGFACTCQSQSLANDGAVHKGNCGCESFHFLVSHGMWQCNCRCKHGHAAHDPATKLCRRCGVDDRDGECNGWEPAWQCHCGHFCGNHTTAFVDYKLGLGHRDWVVSGVRLETARIAEKFRERPIHEQVQLRNSVGLSEANLFAGPADYWSQETKAANKKSANKRRQDYVQRSGFGGRVSCLSEETSSPTEEPDKGVSNDDDDDDGDQVKETSNDSKDDAAGEEEEAKDRLPSGYAPCFQNSESENSPDAKGKNSDDFFQRHQRDVKDRAERRQHLKERFHREDAMKAPFIPRTNHTARTISVVEPMMAAMTTTPLPPVVAAAAAAAPPPSPPPPPTTTTIAPPPPPPPPAPAETTLPPPPATTKTTKMPPTPTTIPSPPVSPEITSTPAPLAPPPPPPPPPKRQPPSPPSTTPATPLSLALGGEVEEYSKARPTVRDKVEDAEDTDETLPSTQPTRPRKEVKKRRPPLPPKFLTRPKQAPKKKDRLAPPPLLSYAALVAAVAEAPGKKKKDLAPTCLPSESPVTTDLQEQTEKAVDDRRSNSSSSSSSSNSRSSSSSSSNIDSSSPAVVADEEAPCDGATSVEEEPPVQVDIASGKPAHSGENDDSATEASENFHQKTGVGDGDSEPTQVIWLTEKSNPKPEVDPESVDYEVGRWLTDYAGCVPSEVEILTVVAGAEAIYDLELLDAADYTDLGVSAETGLRVAKALVDRQSKKLNAATAGLC